MPHTIDLTARAPADIRAVVAWLTSQNSSSTAARWHAGILATARSLAAHPDRCAIAVARPFLSLD